MVRGVVQGVWFRESCRRVAVAAGVVGWVRNLPDGTVEAWLEGPRDAVGDVVAWCRVGPPAATVTGLDIVDLAPAGLEGFTVR